jgi:hypothetical protein
MPLAVTNGCLLCVSKGTVLVDKRPCGKKLQVATQSKMGIYYVMLRGNERKDLFCDEVLRSCMH